MYSLEYKFSILFYGVDFSCKLGVRHLLAVMVFFGFFNDYTLRTNLSIALVAMVNNTDMNPKVLQNSTKCTDVIIQEEETSNQVI